MSGREETPESVEAPEAENEAAQPSQVPAAPPSFGNAGIPQPEPGPPEESSASDERVPAEDSGPSPAGSTDHLDGPKAPWWETAPAAGEADEALEPAEPPAFADTAERAVPAAPPERPSMAAGWAGEPSTVPPPGPDAVRKREPSPGTLVAGPGMAAFDSRGALPAPEYVMGDSSPDFADTDPDGIPTMMRGEPATMPEEAFGGPPSNVATSAGMAPPSETAPTFDLSTQSAAQGTAQGAGAPAHEDFAARLSAADPHSGHGGTSTATLPVLTPQNPFSGPPGVATDPAHGTEGAGAPPERAPSGSRRGGRRGLIAIGGLSAVLLAGLAFVGIQARSDGSPEPAAASSAPSTGSPAPQQAQPSPSAPAPTRTTLTSSIDSERTDRRPLTLSEVFPTSTIMLGGRAYKQDKVSVNHQCGLTARGAMVTALERGRCRSVVRATFVNGKKYAVTTGVAVMPTRNAALAANRAGDPSRYEWFRGMRGKVATKIDQAGGYASSTVRGRYIIYSYAQYVDGTRPQPGDQALRILTRQFIAYAVRPIDRRAR